MTFNKNSILNNFLISFFALFEADVKGFIIDNEKIIGVINWKDEDDEQSFSWIIDIEYPVLLKLKQLCDFLKEHNLMLGDKITISSIKLEILLQKAGWNTREIQQMIDLLCSIRINMLDDGKETDSFFIHF